MAATNDAMHQAHKAYHEWLSKAFVLAAAFMESGSRVPEILRIVLQSSGGNCEMCERPEKFAPSDAKGGEGRK